MPRRSVPWSQVELTLIREATTRWNRSSRQQLVADIQTISPGRTAAAIKLRFLKEVRSGDRAHPAMAARIVERWRFNADTLGGASKVNPKNVMEMVNDGLLLGRRLSCGPRVFVEESIRGGFLPPNFDWKTLCPDARVCPRCEIKKQASLFGYDPASMDGLKRYCFVCRNQFVKSWRKVNRSDL